MADARPSENRRSPRRSLKVEFTGSEGDGAGELLWEGADLSAEGTFLVSDLLLEVDETTSLEFRLPGRDRPIRAEARVIWVRRFPDEGEQAGMGLKFVGMSDEDRRALTEFVAGDS